jgi:hypothetical protein
MSIHKETDKCLHVCRAARLQDKMHSSSVCVRACSRAVILTMTSDLCVCVCVCDLIWERKRGAFRLNNRVQIPMHLRICAYDINE